MIACLLAAKQLVADAHQAGPISIDTFRPCTHTSDFVANSIVKEALTIFRQCRVRNQDYLE